MSSLDKLKDKVAELKVRIDDSNTSNVTFKTNLQGYIVDLQDSLGNMNGIIASINDSNTLIGDLVQKITDLKATPPGAATNAELDTLTAAINTEIGKIQDATTYFLNEQEELKQVSEKIKNAITPGPSFIPPNFRKRGDADVDDALLLGGRRKKHKTRGRRKARGGWVPNNKRTTKRGGIITF